MLSVVTLPDRQKEACAEAARDLLARIEAGEVVGLTIIMEHPNGTYTVGGPGTMSRLQTAGALLDAAVKRLAD
jgi:hypothetical protein